MRVMKCPKLIKYGPSEKVESRPKRNTISPQMPYNPLHRWWLLSNACTQIAIWISFMMLKMCGLSGCPLIVRSHWFIALFASKVWSRKTSSFTINAKLQCLIDLDRLSFVNAGVSLGHNLFLSL